MEYIGGDPQQLPHRCPDVIRNLRSPKGEKDMPYAELNYQHVLCNADDIDGLKQKFGVLIIVNTDASSCTTNHVDDILFRDMGKNWSACQLASIVEYCAGNDILICMPPCRISYSRRHCPGR